MIGRVRGTLLYKLAPQLLVDVQGIGYEIEAPMTVFYELPEVGKDITLYTHLVVREDAHQLFGFLSDRERAMFRQLLKVNGIGAKSALAILSGISADGLARCVAENDTASLTRIPGIGKKTAERLVIELRDRLNDWGEGPILAISGTGSNKNLQANSLEDAVSALITLGYKPLEASRMVREFDTKELTSEEIIRRALQAAMK